MYEKELENLGLSEKEAKIYLAALELGPETAQNIAKKAAINRATTYVQIELLKEKGLVSEVVKGKKTLYTPESPDRLNVLINKLQKDIELKKSEIGRLLPVLKEMFSGMGERPKVRFYEGVEGAKAMRDEFTKIKSKEVYSFSNIDSLLILLPEEEASAVAVRQKKNVHLNVIYTSKNGPTSDASNSTKHRIAKYIPYKKFPIPASIAIFDNKVAMNTYNAKPIAVIVESQEIADTLIAIFKLLWATL